MTGDPYGIGCTRGRTVIELLDSPGSKYPSARSCSTRALGYSIIESSGATNSRVPGLSKVRVDALPCEYVGETLLDWLDWAAEDSAGSRHPPAFRCSIHTAASAPTRYSCHRALADGCPLT